MMSWAARPVIVAALVAGAVVAQPAVRGPAIQVAPTLPPPTATTTTVPSSATTNPSTGTPYRVPVADVSRASWGKTHSSYPATDIFVACGAPIVAPVNGKVLEVRRTNDWTAAVDNPATRGGRSVAILGDDGVRYYFAHFDSIEANLAVGARVTIGETLGAMGKTGRASVCHLHFGISPPCPSLEYIVRRGVVWPYPYLDAWRKGQALSPAAEVQTWLSKNPTACAAAAADPYAGDSL